MEEREERGPRVVPGAAPGTGRPWPAMDWPRLAAVSVCVVAALFLSGLLLKHAPGILLPFFLAWLLSLVIRPAVRWLTTRARLPRRPVAAVLVLLLTGLAGWLVVAGVRRGVTELERLVMRWGGTEGGSALGDSLVGAMDWINSLSSHLPLIRRFESTPGFENFCTWLDGAVRSAVGHLMERLSASLSAGAVGLVRLMPSAFVFVVILLLSCYYFSADDGRLREELVSLLPARPRAWAQANLPDVRRRVGTFFRRYLRAYLLLMLITFAEIFVGLSFLHVSYAFLLALVISVVDLLPVFGTGTVLVPWAIGCFLTRDVRTGSGLLILYGVTVIVRQVAEPRLVGAGLGLHPLLSLAGMYAGLRLCGVPGMILGPLCVAGLCGLMKRTA